MSTSGHGIVRQFARARRLSVRFRQRIESAPLRRECRAAGVPLPPGPLMHLVAGTEDARWFLDSGRSAVGWFGDVLARHGRSLSGLGALLDFGCGAGRVLRHLADLDGVERHGVDQNPKLVGWCRENLPFASVRANGLDRPLPYADGSFDLVFALSVFTHLPEPMQDHFMAEARRVLRPRGLLLFTTHGDRYRDHLSDRDRAEYDAGRLVVHRGDRPGGNHCASFHPPAYVRDRLGEGFDLLEQTPEGALANPCQDLNLFCKRS